MHYRSCYWRGRWWLYGSAGPRCPPAASRPSPGERDARPSPRTRGAERHNTKHEERSRTTANTLSAHSEARENSRQSSTQVQVTPFSTYFANLFQGRDKEIIADNRQGVKHVHSLQKKRKDLSLEVVKQKQTAASQLRLFWYILLRKIRSCRKNSWHSLGFNRKIMKDLSKSSYSLPEAPNIASSL